MHTRGSIHQWIPRRDNQTVQSLQLQEVVAGALTIIAFALTIACALNIACALIIARRAQIDSLQLQEVAAGALTNCYSVRANFYSVRAT